MSEWRDIPTKYKWDGDSLIDPRGVITEQAPQAKPNSPSIATYVAQVASNTPYVATSVVPVTAPPSVNIDTTKVEVVQPKPEMTTEEQAAATKMEEMLDKVLALLGQKAEKVEPQTLIR
jgi:hypothetical protein